MAAFGWAAVGCSGAALSSPHDAGGSVSSDRGIGAPGEGGSSTPFDGGTSTPLDGEIICTLIGCEDEFTATVTVDATMVPAGNHTLTVTIDGAATSCSFNLPELPNLLNDPCAAGFSLNVPGQPTDGKFTEMITIHGTPSSINFHQTLDGTVVLDQTVAPTYQTNQPNGPACGPTCHQAGAEWTIP
jgi:hypothetical protein